MICQAKNQESKKAKFISVRFGNVLGSRGSVIPIFKEQISKGGPVKITHKDMSRYFMVTSEACRLVMQAGAMGKGGEVFVLDMGSPVKIIDLANKLINLVDPDETMKIKIDYTDPRPGEKLSEEMLTAEEGTMATQDKKIFITKIFQVDEKTINSGVANLMAAADKSDKKTIIGELKRLISSYRPSEHVLNNK
jgi:FlaA1/EpsC-like NDP-sugar epimerase